jgi:hypothetical protein
MTRWAERAKNAINQRSSTDKTDKSLAPSLLAVSSVPTESIVFSEKRVSSVLTVSVPANVERAHLNSAQMKDSDRWCWPHSSAMNGQEIDIFLIRLEHFRSLGVDLDSAEKLADRLVIRDRDLDDRIVCFECHFLRTGWHCMNSQNAGVCLQHLNSKLPNDFVHQLQRCPGFKLEVGEVNGHR